MTTTEQHSPFRESLVTELTRWSAVEQSELFPDQYTFPAYGGSGVIFYGLDASGFQGVNCQLSAKFLPRFGTMVDDLNVYHKRMQSTHMLYDDTLGPTNQMPLGYMTFDLSLDGFKLGPGELTFSAQNWRRVTDLRDGTTVTSYEFKRGIGMTVEHLVLPGSTAPRFRVRFAALDGKPHIIGFRFALKPRTRYGLALWDQAPEYLYADEDGCVMAAAKTLQSGQFQAVDDYELGWGLYMSGADHQITEQLGRLALTAFREFTVTPEAADSADLVLHFGSSATQPATAEATTAALQEAKLMDYPAALAASRVYWDAFFARTASIETNNVAEDYLFHKSLAMLTTGVALDSGIPANFSFMAGCTHWRNSTFHDSMHVARGLMQANALPESQQVLYWMRDYEWQKEARPIYWLTRYDGLPLTKADNDTAFMAFTIIGLIPVLYAETISKQRLAEDGIYQMVRHLAEYATRHMLLERDGQYYLKVVTVHDLTSEALETPAKQDAFVLISLRPLLRKAAEYAERLGVDAEQRASWRTVAEHLYIPRDAEGFFLSADEGRRMGWPFFWIPIHCLSPRDPQIPAAQLEFWQSRLKAGPGHPWGSFVTSAMASGWGQGANADALLLAGINLETYGLGYFAEFGLEGLYTWRATMLANLPPFCTAHGAYLYAVAQYFVRGSIWEERLEIGPPANSVHAAAPWTIQRLRALGGGLVSAQRDLSTVNGTVTAPPEHALEVTLLRPTAFTGTVLELRVNETLRTIDAAESATFTVHAGETACFTLGASCRCGNAMLSC